MIEEGGSRIGQLLLRADFPKGMKYQEGVYLSLLTGIGPALENRNKTAKFLSLIIRSVSKQFSEVYGAHLAGVAAQVIIITTIQLFIVCTFHQIPAVHF